MFGKGNFDGQFRTTPNVSIRGATKSENKEQLLKRAHEQRSQREVGTPYLNNVDILTLWCEGSAE